MINTIIFDMDGVLFDTERLSCACWEEAGEAMHLTDLREGVRGCVGLNHNDARELMAGLYGEDFPFDEFHDTVHTLIRRRIMAEGLPIKDGVMEILEYLADNRYILGLASSTSRNSVMEHLNDAGITHYFKEIITGDMVEHSKPQPDIYLLACKKLGVSPAEAIAIEDSPNGIRSACLAGMKPVMVPDLIEPTPEIEEMLFGKFDSLHDVLTYLKERK